MKMEIVTDPEEFETIKFTIKNIIGFNTTQYSDKFLARRIDVRLRALGLNSYLGYIKILYQNPNERKLMNQELTIHVTHFFRDKSMWTSFKNELIPKLIINKKNKIINVFSAGCSSGEEALSIAISFVEALGENLGGYTINIIAVEIEENTLNKAKIGIYDEIQFKEMDDEIKEKYFIKIKAGKYKAKKIITNLVKYEVNDFLSSLNPSKMDIIFCRNTVIYFSLKTKIKLYDDFYNKLVDHGFLILGKTEILHGHAKEKFDIFNSYERIYQKAIIR
jgi:chemotaxis protein methyltransferase CheR